MMIFSYFYLMIEGAIQKALNLYDSQFQQNLVQSILPIWLIFFIEDRHTNILLQILLGDMQSAQLFQVFIFEVRINQTF